MINENVITRFSRYVIPLVRKLSPERVCEVRQAKVRLRAYHLWEEAGRPCGQEDEFWSAGERAYKNDLSYFYRLFAEPCIPNHKETCR